MSIPTIPHGTIYEIGQGVVALMVAAFVLWLLLGLGEALSGRRPRSGYQPQGGKPDLKPPQGGSSGFEGLKLVKGFRPRTWDTGGFVKDSLVIPGVVSRKSAERAAMTENRKSFLVGGILVPPGGEEFQETTYEADREQVTERQKKSREWQNYLMGFAKHAATKSKDSTKVGAVLVGENREVLLSAFNGPPMGVEDRPERFERPTKYLFASHAEANLIAFAARRGIQTEGKAVYVTHMPCAACARTLIQAGITDVVYGSGTFVDLDAQQDAVLTMFREAEVDLSGFIEAEEAPDSTI